MNCGIPTREDDGHQVALSVTATGWDPYARGRRQPAARAPPDLRVGPPPPRPTGPTPHSAPWTQRRAPTPEHDGYPTEEPSSSLWGPYARGRRADAGP